MEYIKLFDGHSSYEAYVGGGNMVKPNVSHCIEENEVHYNKLKNTRLRTKFNVSDASNATVIGGFEYVCGGYLKWVNEMCEYLVIDGVRVETEDLVSNGDNNTFYQFDTNGIHTIDYILKESYDYLPSSFFYNCVNLVEAEIPESITSLYAHFESSLSSVTLSEGLIRIGLNVFSGCDGLESINIPDSVQEIENYSFCLCHSIPSDVALKIESINPTALECPEVIN